MKSTSAFSSRRIASVLSVGLAGLAAAGALAASSAVPASTGAPAISGSAVVGEELTAANGTWSGEPTSFTFQWQRCNSSGGSCVDIANATARSYGVRTIDTGDRLRVAVTATNTDGKATATSNATGVVSGTNPPPPPPPAAANKAPTIGFLSLRRVGIKVYARFRVCDDGIKPVTIIQRDVKPGVAAYTRRFANQARPCQTTSRNWTPPARFRNGRYTATLRAVDKSGKTSATVSRSVSY